MKLAMANFVKDHVVDTIEWGLYEFWIQQNAPVLQATAPALGHGTQLQLARKQSLWFCGRAATVKAMLEHGSSPFLEPQIQST